MSGTSTAQALPFTWDDYRSWGDEQRWEILDGDAYAMSPAPTTRHQYVHREIFSALCAHFRGRKCSAFDFPLEPGEEPPVVREPPGHYRAAAAQ